MPTRIYPCICGFRPPNISQSMTHRKECVPWQNRTHPNMIKSYRQRRTQELQAKGELRYPPCKVCGNPVNKHAGDCMKGRATQAALDLLKKNDMNARIFCRFLRVLSKAYGDKEVDDSVFCLWEPLP